MTSRPDAAGAGPSGPGGPRRPAARTAESPLPATPDTGPIPVAGRPSPPPTRGAPAAAVAPPTGPTAVPPATAEMAVPPTAAAPPTEHLPAALLPEESLPAGASRPAARRGSGRAGRDLVAAVGVGLGLGGVILASLLVYRPAFLLVLTAAILLGVVELVRALEAGRARAPLAPLVVGTVAMFALAWTRGPDGLVAAFLFTVVAVLLWRLGDGPESYLRDASAGVLVALYVPLLAGFAVLLLVPEDGALRVLVFIATVVGNDVGGYTAGVLWGRHPMAPSVSPKKSWEGMVGSVVACVAVATPIVVLGLGGPWWSGVLLGAALAVTATAGDLGESLIKRDLGIKDMGTLLPGHGGIMDRLDSLLPSAVVAYLLLSWVAPPA
ncbi:phosphatidate cytidylyltransferase [Geodermatophilus bullaregiensis]|uniref:phosphatidate cytidylyltransferase n=1 Tax=Geodermatophilus bullaregiensis TaxID=1564160 RepID=UPI00195C79B1|nr:phosphatidate cytidylyltransferase [Geodermatophilus bullaregiensis]MBM7805464.1 phosphatidate cytidylyltransferase [Geodermatophilus bullaregiensis]